MDLKNKLETTTKNHQASIQNLEAKFDRFVDKQFARPFGSLPSNTQPNLKGSSSKPYHPPQAQNEHVNDVFTHSGKSYDPPDNPNKQTNNSETPINFDSDDEDDKPIPQPKPKNPKPVKETPIPKPYKPKIPYPQRLRKEKMEAQYGKFLDLIRGVRINVPLVDILAGMPNYGKLLKELTLFHTTDAVIRVKQKQVNLGVGTERMIFHIDSAMKHSYSNDDTCFSIDVIDEILEEDFDALLDENSKILHSIEGTILEEKLFAEFDEFMAMTTDENSESESDTEEPPFKKITFNTDYKIKTSLEEPPTNLELKSLPDNLEYVFLEEPFFLLVIISSRLSKKDKNKLEKCYFMVKEGIMLGHKVSEVGLEVDKAKIEVISKLPPPTNIKETSDDSEVDDNFPGETLMEIDTKDDPWFADFAKYLVSDIIPKGMTYQQKKKIFSDLRHYFWEEPYLFKVCSDVTVDYVSKWAEAQALPTNNARVVITFLKKLFCRFGMPKALINDRGTHFCNKIMEKTMKIYGVNHRFSTSYHPQISGQVENTNRALKRILEKTVKDNPAIWSRKLNDAL
ncbi:reverse transcriptase domain-containing protein [Tanacetum coccineum]